MKKILLLAMTVMMLLSSVCCAANWEWIGSNSKVDKYLDLDSLTYRREDSQINKHMVLVWGKSVYTDKGARQKFENGNDPDLVNTEYTLDRVAFNLNTSRYAVVEIIYYDGSGNKLRDVDLAREHRMEWKSVTPDSYGDKVLQEIRDQKSAGNIR